MTINKQRLRRLINEVLLNEEAPPKPGQEKAETEGTLNVSKIANALGLDSPDLQKLSAAVKAAKQGKRLPAHNAVLADVLVKLMNASPNDTATVMNVFKSVSANSEEEKK